MGGWAGSTVGEALPCPLEVGHVLPPPCEQLRGVAPVDGKRRGGREGLVVLDWLGLGLG